jgi:3-hydroxyisobutyrate dehydrogenase
MVAYLGTGLLGSGFVKKMLENGQEVQVWNRTASKANALETFGAKAFATPAEAVKGASVIHLTLSDDASVDDVLEMAKPGMEPGVTIIDHTTTTARGAIQRIRQWADAGYTYFHAPVFMGPINALEATGYMLVSGNQDIVKKLEPQLATMTGKVINFGAEDGKAAAMKLMGNLFLITFTAGIADTMAISKALNITGAEMNMLFDTWNPGAALPSRLKRMLSAQYDNPSWELGMARKDARLMMEEAANANTILNVIPAIAAEMDRWIDKGMAHKDWSVICSASLPKL